MKAYGIVTLALMAFTLEAPAPPAAAHHCFPAEFNAASPVTLTGAVSAVEWVNPHVWVHLVVTEPGKPDQAWMVSGGTPNTLLRTGLSRDMLVVGASITIKAWRANDEKCLESALTHVSTCKAEGNEITFPDGRKASMGASGEHAPWEPYEPPPPPSKGVNGTEDRAIVGVGTYCRSGPEPVIAPKAKAP